MKKFIVWLEVFAIVISLFAFTVIFSSAKTSQEFLNKEIASGSSLVLIKNDKETAMNQLYISVYGTPEVFWFKNDYVVSSPSPNCHIVLLNKD